MYARGKKSVAICDRCADKIPYRELKQEWNGLWVCRGCWDPKHEQIEPRIPREDPRALEHPRPDNNNYFTEVVSIETVFPPTSGQLPWTGTVTTQDVPTIVDDTIVSGALLDVDEQQLATTDGDIILYV